MRTAIRTFVLAGLVSISVPSALPADIIERVAVRVADQVVTYTEFLKLYIPMVDHLKSQNKSAAEINRARAELLELIIQGLVMQKFGADMKVAVRMEEIRQQINQEISKSGMSRAEFAKSALEKTGISSLELLAFQQRYVATRQRIIRMLEMQNATSIDPVTESEITECFETKYREAMSDEKRKVSHIVFDVADTNDWSQIDAAIKKAEECLAKLKEGMTFEDAAAEYSSDRFTKSIGGRLGEFTRQALSRETTATGLDYGTIAFGLKEGAHSEILQGKNGLHIIFVEKITSGNQATLDDAREPCRQQITFERYAEVLNTMLTQMRREYQVEVFVS